MKQTRHGKRAELEFSNKELCTFFWLLEEKCGLLEMQEGVSDTNPNLEAQ